MLLKYYTNGTPSPVLLKQLSQSLQANKLLIIPTDTAYSIRGGYFFNSNVAQIIGIVAAMTMTRLVRSIGAGTAIRRLADVA